MSRTNTKELIAVYYDSLVFQNLSANTKRDYKYCIEAVWHTMVDNKVLISVEVVKDGDKNVSD